MSRPQPEVFDRFSNGETTSQENRHVVRWLLLSGTLSQQQQRAAQEVAAQDEGTRPGETRPGETRSDETLYDEAFARARARIVQASIVVDGETERAETHASRIASMTVEQLEEAEEEWVQDARLTTWEICRRLSEVSASIVNSEPQRAVRIARLATRLAAKVPAAEPGPRLAADLEAATWAQLGNALRVATDLRAAEEALETSERLLVEGTGDPVGRAKLVGFMASLRADQRQYQASLVYYRQARRLARRVGDGHLAGRILFNEARVHAYLKEDAKAIRDLERALGSIDPAIEPRLALVARHNLLSYLESAGRAEEAWQELDGVRILAREVGDPLDLVRLVWLEGRIAARLDNLERAESCYDEARDALMAQALGYDAALVSLELAKVYLRQGATAKVKLLASSLLPVFAARDVHQEAQAALQVFCHAAEAERAGLTLVEEVREFLERARSEPSLRFQATQS